MHATCSTRCEEINESTTRNSIEHELHSTPRKHNRSSKLSMTLYFLGGNLYIRPWVFMWVRSDHTDQNIVFLHCDRVKHKLDDTIFT